MRKAPKSNNNNKKLTKQRCCVLCCCCCCGVYLFAMVSGSCRRQLREPCTVLRSHVPFSLYLLVLFSRDANHCKVCSSKCQHLLPLFNSCDFHDSFFTSCFFLLTCCSTSFALLFCVCPPAGSKHKSNVICELVFQFQTLN